jgi:hypothetical protein
MKEFISISPLKVLEKTSRKELGKGNLGVLIARAGVGKTACLIHIAFNNIFRQKKLVHVSLEESPDKITSYYNVMYSDVVKALDIIDDREYLTRIERGRMILGYLNRSFDTGRLRASLGNLANELEFLPSILIVDGLDFENAERAIFEEFKDIALEFEVEIWFSALSHRHITDVNERGIPYPCHKLDDLFSIIMQLQTGSSGVFLKLLKDHDNPTFNEISVRLDPGTFLSMD